MNPFPLPPRSPQAQEPAALVPALVAKVYEQAPPAVRSRLLEQLLKPLGVLSVVAVANGVFAHMALGTGWTRLRISTDDLKRIDASDVMALVHHVQQVSAPALDSLGRTIASAPVLAGSAAAAMLLTLLHKQSRNRPPVLGNDFDPIT